MAEKKLIDKQWAFVDEYLIDLNATRAYDKVMMCSCSKCVLLFR